MPNKGMESNGNGSVVVVSGEQQEGDDGLDNPLATQITSIVWKWYTR